MADTFTITQTFTGLSKSFLPHETGHITLDGGIYTRYNLSTGLWIGYWTTPAVARGYVEWDISDMGTSVASVTSVKLLYYSIRATGNDAMYATQNIIYKPSITVDDSATNGLVWDVLGSSPSYVTSVSFPIDNVKNSIQVVGTSGSAACYDVASQVSLGWFSIGFRVHTESAPEKSEYLYTRDPAPTLYVEYTNTSICTLNQPKTITRINTRKTESFLFPDGTFKRHDIGAGGKIITMQGTETSSAVSNFNTLDAIMTTGETITLSNMNNSDLDTDWYITNFNWVQNEAYVDRYDWTLTLKET